MLLLPAIASLVFFRTQNYTPLLQLGESGFPTLLVHGENDRIINTFVRVWPWRFPPTSTDATSSSVHHCHCQAKLYKSTGVHLSTGWSCLLLRPAGGSGV
jgi:pimeloyl-ACP methyl ester carboxylesterase